jgi:hypothetical protein
MTKRHDDPAASSRHEQAVEEGLTAIFKDDQGAMPDLKTFEPRRSRWWVYALLAATTFLVALITAAWAGFSVFKPFRGFSGQGLAILIEGPERIALGQETSYFIHYQNRTSEPIADAVVKISFPSDFVVAAVEPAPTDESQTWRIGALPVDGRGTIKIRGTFTGAIGTQTAIQVVGTYRPSSVRSDLDALATKVITYAESVLIGTLEVPVKVLPGDRVTFVYHLENRGQEPFQSLRAHLTLPDGFQLDATSTAKLLGRTAEMLVGTIAPGASSTMRLSGSFASGASGEAHVIAEAGRLSSEGVFLSSQKVETSFMVLAGDLSLKLVVNGQDQDIPIAYGSALRFGIGYENTASEDLEDVRIRFRLEQESPTGTKATSLLDWTTLIETSSATRSGQSLAWDKTGIPTLGRLPPREEGTIGFSLNALPSSSGTSALAVRAILEAEVRKVGTTTVNRIVRAIPMILRYSSDVRASTEARYFSEEGAPLGSGPLPPLVGQTTTYRVEWKLEKQFHELANLKLRATLPNGVAWTGTTVDDAGSLLYDEATRSIQWTLNRMPADIHEQTIRFDLAVTPNEADANRFAKVMGETRFEATDVVTGETIIRTNSALTTDLETDESATGKGVVRKP